MAIKYPDCEVQLTGVDSNAFAIIGTVQKALRAHLKEAGMAHSDVDIAIAMFQEQATSGDYDNVIITCMDWVTVS